MNELTEKQKYYARYLAKLPAAQRNGILANMKPSLRVRIKKVIEENAWQRARDLSAAEIAALETRVRKMYLARLKKESPLKHTFLEPMVGALIARKQLSAAKFGGRLPSRTTLINEVKKLESEQC